MIDYIAPVEELKGRAFHVHAEDVRVFENKLSTMMCLKQLDWVISIEHEDLLYEGSKEAVEGLLPGNRHLEKLVQH